MTESSDILYEIINSLDISDQQKLRSPIFNTDQSALDYLTQVDIFNIDEYSMFVSRLRTRMIHLSYQSLCILYKMYTDDDISYALMQAKIRRDHIDSINFQYEISDITSRIAMM